MSRPVFSSAIRRLSHVAPSPRPFSASRSTLNRFSASSYTTSSSVCRQSLTKTSRHTSIGTRSHRVNASPFAAPRQHAAFSSSSVRPAAVVVQNEKKDEEGKVLMVDISSRAAEVSLAFTCALCLSVSSSCLQALVSGVRGKPCGPEPGVATKDLDIFPERPVETGPGIVLYACLVYHIRP